MKTISYWILLFVLCISCATNQQSGNKQMDFTWWHTTTLRVTGMGISSEAGNAAQKKLMCERAAKMNALQILQLQIKNLPVDETSKVEQYLPPDWTATDFSVENVVHEENGVCTLTLSMPLKSVWEIVSKSR